MCSWDEVNKALPTILTGRTKINKIFIMDFSQAVARSEPFYFPPESNASCRSGHEAISTATKHLAFYLID